MLGYFDDLIAEIALIFENPLFLDNLDGELC
jgi:hypothetical protein